MASLVIGLLTGGSAAGAGAATAGTAAAGAATAGAAAGSTFSLGTLLQGTATLLGAFSAIGAGNAEATALELQAQDADRQQPLETLQGISRRTSIKKELADSIGGIDTAYAASGVDLSFGTPSVARKEAFRGADTALTSDMGTQQTRQARLSERSESFRRAGRRARSRGYTNALLGGLNFGLDVYNRG